MNRRIFVQALGLAAAGLALPTLAFSKPKHVLHGDGIHDDTKAVQAWMDGEDVVWADGSKVGAVIANRSIYLSGTVYVGRVKHKQILTIKNSTFYCKPVAAPLFHFTNS